MNIPDRMKEELESRNAAACKELRQKYGKEAKRRSSWQGQPETARWS